MNFIQYLHFIYFNFIFQTFVQNLKAFISLGALIIKNFAFNYDNIYLKVNIRSILFII